MSIRRITFAGLATALVAVAVLVAAPGDAQAVTGKGFTVPARQTVEADEPAIPGNDPVTTTGGAPPDPQTCASLPSCMVVPMKIVVPERNTGDDFVVNVSVSWESRTLSDNNVQPVQQNDMDIWVYDDGQTEKAQGSSGYTVIGTSASSDNPEKVRLFEPLLGTYNLVVNNFSGANTGWHVKAESTVGVFEKPFESLAPNRTGGTDNANNKPGTTLPPPPTTVATTTTVTVPEGAIIPDNDFEGGAFAPEKSSFDDQLASTQEATGALRSLKESGAAKSPSGLSLFAWMVLFPAAIGGAVVLALRVRRSRAHAARAATSS